MSLWVGLLLGLNVYGGYAAGVGKPPPMGAVSGYLVGAMLEKDSFTFSEGEVTGCAFKAIGEISVYHCRTDSTTMQLGKGDKLSFEKVHVFYKNNKAGEVVEEYIYEGKTAGMGSLGALPVRLTLQKIIKNAKLIGTFEVLSLGSRVAVVIP